MISICFSETNSIDFVQLLLLLILIEVTGGAICLVNIVQWYVTFIYLDVTFKNKQVWLCSLYMTDTSIVGKFNDVHIKACYYVKFSYIPILMSLTVS